MLGMRDRRNTGSFCGRCPIHDPKGFPETTQFGKAERQVHHAQPGYGASKKIVEQETTEMKRVSQQDVVFPKLRPRHKHQEEPDLEAEKNKSNGQEAVNYGFENSG